jgi:selenium-binding protein 1
MARVWISALALASLSQAISIPSIPKIQGVTTPLIQPLYDLLPALPILQAPLPPLDSPSFTPSDIKPKKIGYYWVGAGDKEHADFLATYSLDDVCTMNL